MLAVLYFICVLFAYALMLCVMSFNVGCFIATILGLTLGNFVFGPLKLADEIKLAEMNYKSAQNQKLICKE